jgi:hypothetical protein
VGGKGGLKGLPGKILGRAGGGGKRGRVGRRVGVEKALIVAGAVIVR